MPQTIEARRATNAKYYQQNRERVIALNRANKARNRLACQDQVWAHLSAHPCVDCGETDPVVLEFDHRDPATKLFNIGAALGGEKAPGDLAREIRKCDVRCANCHRRRTARIGGHWKSLRSLTNQPLGAILSG